MIDFDLISVVDSSSTAVIEQVQKKYFVHYQDSALVEAVVPLGHKGPWIAGGAALAWFQNRSCQTDIDVFFRNEQQYRKILDHIKNYFSETNTKRSDLNKNDRIVHQLETANAYTIKVDFRGRRSTIQLIKRDFYSTPTAIIDNFDITVCQIAWDGSRVFLGKSFKTDLDSRQLVFHKFSPHSHKRMVKYMSYGYEPSRETFARLLAQKQEVIDWTITGSDHYA